MRSVVNGVPLPLSLRVFCRVSLHHHHRYTYGDRAHAAPFEKCDLERSTEHSAFSCQISALCVRCFPLDAWRSTIVHQSNKEPPTHLPVYFLSGRRAVWMSAPLWKPKWTRLVAATLWSQILAQNHQSRPSCFTTHPEGTYHVSFQRAVSIRGSGGKMPFLFRKGMYRPRQGCHGGAGDFNRFYYVADNPESVLGKRKWPKRGIWRTMDGFFWKRTLQ